MRPRWKAARWLALRQFVAARLRTSRSWPGRSKFLPLPESSRARSKCANGTSVILDGSKGTLRLSPPPAELERIRQRQARHRTQRTQDIAHAHEPAVTTDGKRIAVFANIGGLRDAQQIAELGGEGVGLLRSEFLFMDRHSAPNEDEQAASYLAIMQAVGPNSPSSCARSMSAATSRCLTCRFRAKTIRSSASAAFVSGSTGRKFCARKFAPRCAPPRR